MIKMAKKFKNAMLTSWEEPKIESHEHINYYCYGEEITPTTDKMHWHIFAQADNAYGITWFQKKFGLPKGTHVKAMYKHGTPEFCRNYCKKDGKFIEWGEMVTQGERTDLKSLKERAHDLSEDVLDIKSDCENVQQMRFVELQREVALKKELKSWKNEPRNVRWYWGESGCGKTETALDESGADTWISAGNLKFFNQYDGEQKAILDDIRPYNIDFNILLRILDRYSCHVEVKGGSRAWMAKDIWITCPMSPTEFCRYYSDENPKQLLRRISEIRKFASGNGNSKEDGISNNGVIPSLKELLKQ